MMAFFVPVEKAYYCKGNGKKGVTKY